MATNNLNISTIFNNAPAGYIGRGGLITLILFTLIFIMPSLVQADGLFDFQMKMAQKGGNAEAEFKVGEMYETGFGVKKDMVEAEKWISKAAGQGHETANFKLLYWDIEKNGINDKNKAKVDDLKAKAKAGNPQAEYYIGKMFANGVGLEQDSDKAIKWLNKAALVGVLSAEREITEVRELKQKQDLAKKQAADKKRAQQKAKKEKEKKAKLEAQRKRDAQKQAEAAAAATLQKQKQADAARQANKQANKQASEKKRAQAEKEALEKQKAEAERQALIKKQEEDEKKRNAKFESDPCSGKSARFLSTCK